MENNEKQIMPADSFADLGGGKIAYIRAMNGAEAKGMFPGLPEIAPGTRLWALFAADGRPILLSDARERALAGAFENDLIPVSIH